MWVVLVGGEGHHKAYNVPPDMWQLIYPVPVPNEFYNGQPWIPPWRGYQNQTYHRQWVVDEFGRRCDRLFFFMPPREITVGLINEGMRRLRGVQVEKLA